MNEDYSKVLFHHIPKFQDYEDIYLLMRESMETEEKFEDTLTRGVKEEFGAEVEIIDFLGSLVAIDNWFGEINKETEVQKTTLYFLTKFKSQDKNQRVDEGTIESKSTLVWLSIEEAIEKMRNFFSKYKINNLNEVDVLNRAREYIDIHMLT